MANRSHGRQLHNSYVYGNTVRNIDIRKELETAPSFEPLKVYEGEARRHKKSKMSFGYVMFLVLAICTLGYSPISYLSLQSDITSLVESVSVNETRLNNLTLANDDEYSKMINTIDYDEIRRVAIEELGMVYASEDQIVSYTRENSDYVRQLSNLAE